MKNLYKNRKPSQKAVVIIAYACSKNNIDYIKSDNSTKIKIFINKD